MSSQRVPKVYGLVVGIVTAFQEARHQRWHPGCGFAFPPRQEGSALTVWCADVEGWGDSVASTCS